MAKNPITEAIIAESNEHVTQPYSTVRKIKGYFRNKRDAFGRDVFGGSADAGSKAKAAGRYAIKQTPMALTATAKKIPIVSYVATIIDKGSQYIADKVVAKIDNNRTSELRSKEVSGSLSVKEMTEMMHKNGNVKVGKDTIVKMHDAVRKVEQAYTNTRNAITGANDCDSVYKAAKNYAYLKYRVVRLQYYLETVRSHIDELSDMNERYGAQIIGFEEGLTDMMDEFFAKANPEYHTANCKNKKHCYFQQHGIV